MNLYVLDLTWQGCIIVEAASKKDALQLAINHIKNKKEPTYLVQVVPETNLLYDISEDDIQELKLTNTEHILYVCYGDL